MATEKTEQPTPKKLQDSRKKGDTPYSRDFSQALLLSAMMAYTVFNGGEILGDMQRIILAPARFIGTDFHTAVSTLGGLLVHELALLFLPYLLIVLGVGFVVEFAQIGFVIAPEKVKFSGKKLNLVANVKNLFSMKNVVEVLKSIIKIFGVIIILTFLIRAAIAPLSYAPPAGLAVGLSAVVQPFEQLVLQSFVLLLVFAIADLAWQRWQRRKRLMMTKDEVKREYKEMEGAPEIKQTRRSLHQEMVNGEAVGAVRKASALVVNPTHIAIALFYDPLITPLPKVLAKGRDGLALAMIAAAKQAKVPIMRDVPLAWALMADAAVDDYIPEELSEPVAAVLRAVKSRLSKELHEP